MATRSRSGFTLVELLVVVAIIAILASIIAVALPRALERAKLARMTGAMNDLRTQLTQYYADSSSFPPAYGYRWFSTRNEVPDLFNNAQRYFNINNFMATLNLYNVEDEFDEFSQGYSTKLDNPDSLSLLEFAPIATQGVSDFSYDPNVYEEIYTGTNLGGAVGQQLAEDRRPFIYIPVNTRQFERAKRYWLRKNDFLATTWDPTEPGAEIAGLTFPPSNYDAYVLISVGPGGDTFGLVDDPPFINNIAPEDRYHVAALRSYFLATRDLNGNGELDFHYQSRISQAEGRAVYTFNNDRPATGYTGGQINPAAEIASFYNGSGIDAGEILPNSLPSLRAPNGYGPYIYVP